MTGRGADHVPTGRGQVFGGCVDSGYNQRVKSQLSAAVLAVALLAASGCDLIAALTGGQGLLCADDQACPAGSICSAGRCQQLAVCTGDAECPRGFGCDPALQICVAPTDASLADAALPDQAPPDQASASDASADHTGDAVVPDTGPLADAAAADRQGVPDTGAPDLGWSDSQSLDVAAPDTAPLDHPIDGGVVIPDSSAADVDSGYLYYQDFSGSSDLVADDGTWVRQNGVFSETDQCTGGADCHISSRSFGNVRVRADLRFDQVCAASYQQAGILVRAQSLGGCNNRYYLCVVDLDDAELLLGKFEDSCAATADYRYDLSGVVAGTWYTMTVTALDDVIRCELAGPGIDPPYWVQYTYLDTTWLSGGVGLRTTGTTASFDNLTVEAY